MSWALYTDICNMVCQSGNYFSHSVFHFITLCYTYSTLILGDIFELLSSNNADWWKVKSSMNEIGYVPANYLERYLYQPILAKTSDNSNPSLKQSEIEFLYRDVLKQCDERLKHLFSLHKHYCLEREIQEILLWIREANLLNVTIDSQATDLELAGKKKTILEELITRVNLL